MGKLGQYSSQAGPEDAGVGARKEPCGARAKVGDPVTVAFGDAFDHGMETPAADMVSHPAWGQFSGLWAEKRCQILAEIAI